MPGPTDERRELKLLKNHAEFRTSLISLTMTADIGVLEAHVYAIARKWFELGRLHYVDGSAVDGGVNPRAVYSRAYYAAYNASKAVRYVVSGLVSLHGDDHKKVAADLPKNFPDLDSWASKFSLLYEHRLRADYDNWSDTSKENVLTPGDCLAIASEFLNTAEQYLLAEYGLSI